MYARILLQADRSRRKFVATVLRWVVMAVRPLKLKELMAAIDLPQTSSTPASDIIFLKDRISQCGYILKIEGNEVHLLHQSAKDYLLRQAPDSNPELEAFHVHQREADLLIARRLFFYLQKGGLEELYKTGILQRGSLKEVLRDQCDTLPLLQYAIYFWPQHAACASREDSMFDLSLLFYQKGCLARSVFLIHYQQLSRPYIFRSCLDYDGQEAPILHFACVIGLVPLAWKILFPGTLKGIFTKKKLLARRDQKSKTPLFVAAQNGHQHVISLLLKGGADVNAECPPGDFAGEDLQSALQVAIIRGDQHIAQCILDERKDLSNKTKNKACFEAVRLDNMDMLRALLANGAEVNATGKGGSTVLHLAAYNNHSQSVQLLLKAGATINATDSEGSTPLHSAAKSYSEASDSIRMLLETGAHVNAIDSRGRTALHNAARSHNSYSVQLLLKTGANIHAADSEGRTPLHSAASGYLDSLEAVRLLLESEANVNAKDLKGQTALHLAADRNNCEIVQLLLENRADINARDDEGRTALHFTNRGFFRRTLTEILIQKGADVNLLDEVGRIEVQEQRRFAARFNEVGKHLADPLKIEKKTPKYRYPAMHVGKALLLSSNTPAADAFFSVKS